MDEMLRGNGMREIEEDVVECIATHYGDIVADMFIHADTNTRDY
jgi:hypothetical protein